MEVSLIFTFHFLSELRSFGPELLRDVSGARQRCFQDGSKLLSSLQYRTLINSLRRVAISTASSFDLIQSLNSGKITPVRETEAPSRIGYIFTGQGAQYYNMGRELYGRYPVYASTLNACEEYLTSLGAPFSLLGIFKLHLRNLGDCTN